MTDTSLRIVNEYSSTLQEVEKISNFRRKAILDSHKRKICIVITAMLKFGYKVIKSVGKNLMK